MDDRYKQEELKKRFDHAVEECAEFISAYAKMSRWGAFSYNPELPKELRETNIDWVYREMQDVREAFDRMQELNWTNEALEEAFPLYNE
jgi:hypothetical protein